MSEKNTYITQNSKGGSRCRAMVLGNFKFRGVQLIWIIVGQGPTVLTVGAGGLFGHLFSPISFSLSLEDGLYCLK